MICKYCGGEYGDDVLACPYCHAENPAAVKAEKSEILEGYDEEAEKIRKEADLYPAKMAGAWSKKVVLGILAGAVACVLLLALFKYMLGVEDRNSLAREQKKFAEMEAFLEADDYAGLEEYLFTKNIKVYEYEKYEQVIDMHNLYERILETDGDLEKFAAYLDPSYINDLMKNESAEMLADMYINRILGCSGNIVESYLKYGQDTRFLGNEADLEKIYQDTVAELKEYGLTDEEIGQLPKQEDAPLWNTILKKVTDYFIEKYESTEE
ncbi:MAG: hypothetical protein IKY23_09660 [Lachnospiraceae bacterium]|nr:hypothetical protein [Lachnospiraceae bacterium]